MRLDRTSDLPAAAAVLIGPHSMTPKIAGAALVVSAILIVYLGLLPTRVLDWAAASISTIF